MAVVPAKNSITIIRSTKGKDGSGGGTDCIMIVTVHTQYSIMQASIQIQTSANF